MLLLTFVHRSSETCQECPAVLPPHSLSGSAPGGLRWPVALAMRTGVPRFTLHNVIRWHRHQAERNRAVPAAPTDLMPDRPEILPFDAAELIRPNRGPEKSSVKVRSL